MTCSNVRGGLVIRQLRLFACLVGSRQRYDRLQPVGDALRVGSIYAALTDRLPRTVDREGRDAHRVVAEDLTTPHTGTHGAYVSHYSDSSLLCLSFNWPY